MNPVTILAHFVSSEQNLLLVAKDIASGGSGSPDNLDVDAINAQEIVRMRDFSAEELLDSLVEARESTIEWVQDLDDSVLDLKGRHPVLGNVNVEGVIRSMIAHQLLHMRETVPLLKGSDKEEYSQ